MASASSLYGLMKFLKREEWREAFEEIQEAHFLFACAGVGIGMDDLADVLGEKTAMTLWGCAFEDFLSRPLPDARNMVDDYLRRRGYKESASSKAYMMAIRRSVMSLYEVSDIVRGQSFLARDLIRGGEPVRVTEHTATKQMAPWDRIAARIVHLGRTYQMTGGALAYGLETSDKLFAELARLEDRLQRGIHDLAEEIGASLDRDRLADIVADGGSLEVAAHLFTRVWLADALDHALNRRLPKLVNAEGDAIVFCTLTFPLAGAAGPGQICSALDVVDDLRRAGDSSFYNWIGPENARGRPTEGIALNTMHSEGGHVLGGIEATESAVVVTTNSLQRNERVRIKLTEVLAGMVGEPTLDAKTPDEAMAKRERAPGANNSAQKLDLSPEEECRIVHSCLDDHYRKGLDRGVPMLGGMTPREAATTAAGRAKVAAWLKYLENQSRKRHEPGNPLASYDIGWLWIELGVTELRM